MFDDTRYALLDQDIPKENKLTTKLNCWEFKKCGREIGGAKVKELGVCPASTESTFHTIFGGKNSGRACWVVAGTFCKGEVQGSFAQKFKNCGVCDFFKQVQKEEGESFQPVNILMTYIDRTHEQRVDERTLELREAKESVEEANRKLAHVNRIASLDMDMAARIQASFFPKEAPKSEAWDTAFVFKPYASVSGDFYDFYKSNGELRGVSLFDVSGHGIAPGLLTLLARSIIHKQFTAGETRRLSTVMENANHNLVQELDIIENYLTGILLRFNGNKVEYVNAGHTDLLIKTGTSGAAFQVSPKGKDFKGNFLGIAALENRYKTLTFPIAKGDFLLLYTDCLTETKNSEGEEYGEERLEKSFAKAPLASSAQEVSQSLLADFYAFIDLKRIKDDLTLIVLKRTGDVGMATDYSI